jgi:hypothetical protein
MLSNGALTPPAIVRYSLKDFQEAVRLADGEAGQQKVLLDYQLIGPEAGHLGSAGEVQRRQRLGGMLNYYYRAAA